ncbi:MAG: hypothetical protein ABII82_06550 [Verrucomicrobiota bacterium]
MARLKSHPVFTLTVSLLLLVALGAGVLLYLTLGKVATAERDVRQKSQALSGYTQRNPFPSAENVEAAKADLARSEELLATMQAALKGRGEFAERVQTSVPPVGPTEAYFDIANFVESMRAAAESAGVAIPAGTRFGFQTHVSTGPERDLIPQVHRQRLVAEYLLTTLLEAAPQELVALQRNRPVAPGAAPVAQNTSNTRGAGGGNTANSPESDFFAIDSRMTAAVPGFVETTAFKLSFIGYTGSLRGFLNEIATFKLPLVVRSVEVEPVANKTDASNRRSQSSAANSLSALFGGAAATTETPAADAAKPIVDQVRSKFTVTIEYINLVEKSADENQENS